MLGPNFDTLCGNPISLLKYKESIDNLKFSQFWNYFSISGLRIKETKEVYEGEVTELTPQETENPMGGMYGVIIKLHF